MKDLDDWEGPRLPPPIPPAPPSWEMLAEPMQWSVGDRSWTITADMLRHVAEHFTDPVPVEAVPGEPPWACWGWIKRVEMRGEALWGWVEWLAPIRPVYGIGAAIMLESRDPATGASLGPRLTGAVVRGAKPVERAS